MWNRKVHLELFMGQITLPNKKTSYILSISFTQQSSLNRTLKKLLHPSKYVHDSIAIEQHFNILSQYFTSIDQKYYHSMSLHHWKKTKKRLESRSYHTIDLTKRDKGITNLITNIVYCVREIRNKYFNHTCTFLKSQLQG